MSEDLRRRAHDQTVIMMAADTAKKTSRSFWHWFDHHHVDSIAVLGITLWLSVRVVGWAMEFAYDLDTKLSGTDKAAIIAAVLTPWGIMQAALFKFYVDLRGKKAENGLLS